MNPNLACDIEEAAPIYSQIFNKLRKINYQSKQILSIEFDNAQVGKINVYSDELTYLSFCTLNECLVLLNRFEEGIFV